MENIKIASVFFEDYDIGRDDWAPSNCTVDILEDLGLNQRIIDTEKQLCKSHSISLDDGVRYVNVCIGKQTIDSNANFQIAIISLDRELTFEEVTRIRTLGFDDLCMTIQKERKCIVLQSGISFEEHYEKLLLSFFDRIRLKKVFSHLENLLSREEIGTHCRTLIEYRNKIFDHYNSLLKEGEDKGYKK